MKRRWIRVLLFSMTGALLSGALIVPWLAHGQADEATYEDDMIGALQADLGSGVLNEEGRALTEEKLRIALEEQAKIREAERQQPDPHADATKIAMLEESEASAHAEQTAIAAMPDTRPIAGNGRIEPDGSYQFVRNALRPTNAWVKMTGPDTGVYLVAGASVPDGFAAVVVYDFTGSDVANYRVLTLQGVVGELRVVGGDGDVVFLQDRQGQKFQVDTGVRDVVSR